MTNSLPGIWLERRFMNDIIRTILPARPHDIACTTAQYCPHDRSILPARPLDIPLMTYSDKLPHRRGSVRHRRGSVLHRRGSIQQRRYRNYRFGCMTFFCYLASENFMLMPKSAVVVGYELVDTSGTFLDQSRNPLSVRSRLKV